MQWLQKLSMPTACHEDSGGTLLHIKVQDRRWNGLAFEVAAERACREALAACGMAWEEFEICLLACDDAKIVQLNETFRGARKATNVLSWPVSASGPKCPGMAESLGDIAISYDSCIRESKELKIDELSHATHLVVHGCLHLLGFGHDNDAEAEKMESLEREILATMQPNIS